MARSDDREEVCVSTCQSGLEGQQAVQCRLVEFPFERTGSRATAGTPAGRAAQCIDRVQGGQCRTDLWGCTGSRLSGSVAMDQQCDGVLALARQAAGGRREASMPSRANRVLLCSWVICPWLSEHK